MDRSTNKPRFAAFDQLRPLYGETRSRMQLRRAVEAGEFPAPKQLSPGRIGWETRALDAHFDACPIVTYATKGKQRAA